MAWSFVTRLDHFLTPEAASLAPFAALPASVLPAGQLAPATRPQVLKPWATDPGFYNDAIGRLGIAEKKGQIELDLPLDVRRHAMRL